MCVCMCVCALDNFQVRDQKTQWLIKKKTKAKQIPLVLQNWKATFISRFLFLCFPQPVPAKEQVHSSPLGTLYQKEANDEVSAILSFSVYSKIIMKTSKSIFHTYWKQLWSQQTLAHIFTEHKNWWGHLKDFSIMFTKSIWQEILHFTCS